MSHKALQIANALVNSNALKFGSFKLKSGAFSPYYIDLAQLLDSPNDFRCIVDIIAEEVKPFLCEKKIAKLASIELKGALFLPSIAERLNVPCTIVRKESKKYGFKGRIAGSEVKIDDRFIFFDDVISNGASKIEGIKLIEDTGGRVPIIIVVVDREEGGKEELEKHGYEVKPIATVSNLVKSLLSRGNLNIEEVETVLDHIMKNR